jgi:predicted MFS family arabinose efflux permease
LSNTTEKIAATPQAVPPSEQELEPLARPSAWALFEVFRHRNYRLFFSGQLVSLMGTWITAVAQGWLVYSLTHSPLLLGVTSFAGQVPVFFISSFGGMISDRVDRRRLLVLTQGLSMLQAATLATLTLLGIIHVWEIIALALFKGFVNAFDVPTRQAFTIDMVGREDLRNAISLNSVMFNLARIVGPTIAGLLVATVGEGICFTIDAISYGAVLISLILMHFVPKPRRPAGNALGELRAGFAYVWRVRQIRVSLMLIAVCSAFGAAYIPLLPAFARDVLHSGSQGLGLLYGAIGCGALCGAYMLARIHERHLALAPILAAALFGVSLILFSHSHWLPLSLALLLPVSFALMLLGGSTNTIIQTVASDAMRGRVVSFYVMGFMGMMPWGSLILGFIANRLGVSFAVTVGGAICLLAAFAAWYDRRESDWSMKQVPAE